MVACPTQRPKLHLDRFGRFAQLTVAPFPKLPLPMDPYLIHEPIRVVNPNGNLVSSAVFAGLINVTDRQTDYSVCNNRPHHVYTVRR